MSAPHTRPAARRRVRTATLIGLWMAAVLGATLVGLTAVGSIGSGILRSGPQPLTQAEVDSRLAAATATPAPSSAAHPGVAAGPTATGDPAAARVIAAGPAGTIVASCVGGTPRVLSVSPAQGFQGSAKLDGDSGPEIKFESDQLKVEARLGCTGGEPTATLELKQG